MFSKRLLQMLPKARAFIMGKVACQWFALLALIVFFSSLATVVALWVAPVSLIEFGGFPWLAAITPSIGEAAASGGQGTRVFLLLAVALITACVKFMLDALARYCGSKAGQTGTNTLRQKLYEKLVALGPTYREHVGTSQAVQLCGEGIQKLDAYLGAYVPQFFYALVAPLTLFLLVLPINALVAIVLLVCVPLIPSAIMGVMKIAKRAMGAYWGSYVDLGGEFLEAVQGLTTLKVYGADERKQSELTERAEGFRKQTVRLLRVQLNSVTIMDFFAYGGAAAGIVVALFQCASGSLGIAQTAFIIFVALEFFMPMRTLGSYFHTGMGAASVIDEVFEVLDAKEAKGCKEILHPAAAQVSFNQVGYAYSSDNPVLREVDFAVEPGSFIGITGESGSGKSTLLGILAGFNQNYTGSATVGGVELSEINPASLHKVITYVPSSGHVFKGTFRTNLMMGDPNANDYRMWNILNQCHLDDFVLNQGGLDAPVSEGGANLSGGQRQRLCLARALLRDTPIYLFDEVTSNIDAESEEDILTTIQELAFFKTVVVASHRLGSIQWADRVYVLDGGRIVESGAHAALMRAGGRYAALWQQQERLEEFAHAARQASLSLSEVSGEVELDIPPAMREAMAAMPPHIATVALQSMRGAKIKRLTQNGSGIPAGHPADIPLVGAGLTELETPQEGSIGALADAGAQAALEEIATRTTKNEPDKARQSRRFVSTFAGLLRLGNGLAGMVARCSLFGVLAAVAAIGVVAFAALGLMSLVGGEVGLPLFGACVGVVCCGIARGFLRYAERLSAHDGTFRTLALIRDKVFEHMRSLAPARLEQRDSGDLVSLLTADIELLEVFYAHTLSSFVVAFVVCAVMVALISALSWQLGVIAAVSYGAIGLALPQISAFLMADPGYALRERSVRLASFVLESLRGLPELLGFDCADLRAEELGGRMGAMAGSQKSVAKRSALFGSASGLLALVCVAFAAYSANALVVSGTLGVSAAALVVIVFAVSFEPVFQLATLGTSIHQTLAAGSRVLDFLAERPQTPEVLQGEELERFNGATLENVSFAYSDGVEVLHEVNLSVQPGAIIHITGKSGAGKSTLLKLLMRFWDASEGSVCVSSKDVSHVKTKSLRAVECYMAQDTHLFSGSIRDNLLLVRPGATQAELDAAVAKASLTDLVARLPQGLDTPLGEIGEGLSSGERQRIGLARAFLSDAPFMLLDEPTSNLDCLNEAVVLQALMDNREGKTILLVSHRPTAAAIADETLTLRRGAV